MGKTVNFWLINAATVFGVFVHKMLEYQKTYQLDSDQSMFPTKLSVYPLPQNKATI